MKRFHRLTACFLATLPPFVGPVPRSIAPDRAPRFVRRAWGRPVGASLGRLLGPMVAGALIAGCSGGGGGSNPSPASPTSPATPASSPSSTPCPTSSLAPGSTGTSSSALAASSLTAAPPPSFQPPVHQMVVKLVPTAVSAATVASPTVAPLGQTLPSDTSRLAGVIARALNTWTTPVPVDGGTVTASTARSAVRTGRPTVSLNEQRSMPDGAHVLALSQGLSFEDAQALAATLATDPEVAYAVPDTPLTVRSSGPTPSDPDYAQQWNLTDPTAGINAPAAWAVTTGSPNVVVAVLDTGYLPHADLAGNLLPGYDFITSVTTGNNGHGRGADATDPGDWVTQQELSDSSGPFYNCQAAPSNSSWHGTRIAGIVGALTNNGLGVAGIDWNARILPVRVMGKCGGVTSDVADALRWAVGLPLTGTPTNPTPAKVVNLSLGGYGSCNPVLQSAINDAVGQGAAVVVAAGNDGLSSNLDMPANCAGVITVGATDGTGNRAWYSNFGSDVTLSAPGTAILSTANTGTTSPVADSYAVDTGTSLATPQVSSALALLDAVNPGLTLAQATQALTSTAHPSVASPGCTVPANVQAPGAGRLDLGLAVAAVLPH